MMIIGMVINEANDQIISNFHQPLAILSNSSDNTMIILQKTLQILLLRSPL